MPWVLKVDQLMHKNMFRKLKAEWPCGESTKARGLLLQLLHNRIQFGKGEGLLPINPLSPIFGSRDPQPPSPIRKVDFY